MIKQNAIQKKEKAPESISLRGALSFILFIILSGGAGLCYVQLTATKDLAAETREYITKADASAQQAQQLQSLNSQLKEGSSFTMRVENALATESTYQSLASTDIRRYASLANLPLGSISFEEKTGQDSRPFKVTFTDPVNYTNFLKFLKGVESNIPKITVSKISTSRNESNITIKELHMNIHLKQENF